MVLPGCSILKKMIPNTIDSSNSNSSIGSDSSTNEELRGVWVYYSELNSILADKTIEQAQTALDTFMDTIVSYNLNTVFFHVRAKSDAYYPSSIFPPASAA
jgi:uncharacterized lipoprotein YddW (UPF0748 family)